MSQSFSCHCQERKKPAEKRQWGVSQRNFQRSAFNGYRDEWSEYSTVICLNCNAAGRTKAGYVNALPDVELKGGRWQYTIPQPDREPDPESPI